MKTPSPLPPERSDILRRAWLHYDQGEWEESVACFERLLEDELNERIFTGFAFDELVRIYRDRGNWEALVRICEKTTGAFAADAHLIQTLGGAYLQAGKPGEAAATFTRLLEIDAANPSYYLLLTEARLAGGDLASAEEALQKALRLEEEAKAALVFAFAQKLEKYGHGEDAEAKLRECVDLEPGNPLYWYSLGDCLIKRAKTAEALRVYQKAIEIGGGAEEGHNRLALSLKREGFLPEAALVLEGALAFNSRNVRGRLLLADIYRELREFEKACALLEVGH